MLGVQTAWTEQINIEGVFDLSLQGQNIVHAMLCYAIFTGSKHRPVQSA